MQDAWLSKFAEWTQTPLYLRYAEELNLEREALLMRGKENFNPHVLSELKGFDQAASFFQRAVDTLRERNKPNEDTDEPEQNF